MLLNVNFILLNLLGVKCCNVYSDFCDTMETETEDSWAEVRVKREETKGELEAKLGCVDNEEKKYRSASQHLITLLHNLIAFRMDIAQLSNDIERIKRMFSAILRYASRNKIHLPQVGLCNAYDGGKSLKIYQ